MSEVALVDQAITLTTLKQFIGTPSIPKRWESLSDMVAAVLYGKELGLAPMESLQRLYIIGGGVAMDGKALNALIHKAGHVLIMEEMSDKRGAVKAMRRDPFNHELIEIGVFEFTWEDAERAGLAGQDTYADYPQDMLYWRAVSRAAKLAFPDVTTGMLTPEELGAPSVNIPADDAAVHIVASALEGEVIETDEEGAADYGLGNDEQFGD